jgi:micrococcal nuclease
MIDAAPPPAIICEAPRALDGDTIACANLPRHVRLLGIDAPELPGHCRTGRQCTPGDGEASTRVLAALLGLGAVIITPKATDRYGRTLARVEVAESGADLSCAMLATGAAVRRYSRIGCPIIVLAGW